ncbi:MAG: tRNA3(Ser)-specific nuclease WapA precursor [Bacteroidetes bacterium ADurb.Bin416]|nr:MAG: tRNA3(Ser)-specific nuclease WapA precursor [Bacteroidetes bacterium ADurb.Bin416]
MTDRNDDAFGYNARSEVTAANVASNDYGYVYDNMGNHLHSTVNTVTNTFEVNALNQYTNITNFSGNTQPVHDLDGNMVSNGVWTYTWDAANQLTAAYSNSVCVVSNAYDHASRRVVKWTPSHTTTFVYDGWLPTRKLPQMPMSGVKTSLAPYKALAASADCLPFRSIAHGTSHSTTPTET